MCPSQSFLDHFLQSFLFSSLSTISKWYFAEEFKWNHWRREEAPHFLPERSFLPTKGVHLVSWKYFSFQDFTWKNRDRNIKVTALQSRKCQFLQRHLCGIRLVWSESSLCAQWVAKDPSLLHADSEDSDQTGRMRRLIWVFAERTTTLLVLSCRGSYIFWIFFFKFNYQFETSLRRSEGTVLSIRQVSCYQYMPSSSIIS